MADEIKSRGFSKARKHDKASIMFTDFKNFTTASEYLSAEELVILINSYFSKFDDIVTKHGIEKIKTEKRI